MKYSDIDLTQLTPEELECLRKDIDNEFHTGDALNFHLLVTLKHTLKCRNISLDRRKTNAILCQLRTDTIND